LSFDSPALSRLSHGGVFAETFQSCPTPQRIRFFIQQRTPAAETADQMINLSMTIPLFQFIGQSRRVRLRAFSFNGYTWINEA
jgi:hypothetical protein